MSLVVLFTKALRPDLGPAIIFGCSTIELPELVFSVTRVAHFKSIELGCYFSTLGLLAVADYHTKLVIDRAIISFDFLHRESIGQRGAQQRPWRIGQDGHGHV